MRIFNQIGTFLILFFLVPFHKISAQTYQEIADSLVDKLSAVKPPIERTDLLNEIAYNYRRISGDSTMKYAQMAERTAVANNYIRGESQAHKNMGIAHYKFNSPKDSMIVHYEKSIALAEQIEDYYTQAACNNNIALLFSYQVDPYRAIKHYLRGIEIFDKYIKEEKSLKALMLANVAHFQISIDNYDKALHYITRAFDIAKRNNYTFILTNYSDEFSEILIEQKRYLEAEEVLQNGLAIGRKLGDEYAKVGNINALAELAMVQNQCEKAAEYTQSVPKLKGKKRFVRHYVNNLLNYAKVASCEKNFDEVIRYSQETIEAADKFKFINNQQAARKLMEYAYHAKGNYQKAYELNLTYNLTNASVIKTKKIASAADLEARYDFEEKEKEIDFLEKEQQLADRYISWLISFLGIILIGAAYIINLLLKRRKAVKLINNKNKELNKYIASNLQLENFAYIASHDLRSPLLTIKSFVELVQKSAKDRLNEEEVQSLDFVHSGSDDMLGLIDGLMNFSTLQKSRLEQEKIALPAFVDYVLDLNKPLIETAKAKIQVDIETPYIQADRSKLFQLLQNLIQNALKFHKPSESPQITIKGVSTSENHLISVTDNGIGIEKSYFEKVFLLFKRLHNKTVYQGTGIGLALCKKVVEMHNGKIWVESKVGEGSTFYCLFPK